MRVRVRVRVRVSVWDRPVAAALAVEDRRALR